MESFVKLCKACKALEWTAQGSYGVTIPGNIQKMCGCGNWGHGLVMNVVGIGLMFELDNLRGLFLP